ncbi:hypothetical protein WDU94_012444 [Cyamophila willieti]
MIIFSAKLTAFEQHIIDYVTNKCSMDAINNSLFTEYFRFDANTFPKQNEVEEFCAYTREIESDKALVLSLLRTKYPHHKLYAAFNDIQLGLTKIVDNRSCKPQKNTFDTTVMINYGSTIVFCTDPPPPTSSQEQSILSTLSIPVIERSLREIHADKDLTKIISSPDTLVYQNVKQETSFVFYITAASNMNFVPLVQSTTMSSNHHHPRYDRLCVLVHRVNNLVDTWQLADKIMRSIWLILTQTYSPPLGFGTLKITKHVCCARLPNFFNLAIVPATLLSKKNTTKTNDFMRFVQNVDVSVSLTNPFVSAYIDTLTVVYERSNQWIETLATHHMADRVHPRNVLNVLDAIALQTLSWNKDKCVVCVYTPVLTELNVSSLPNLALDFVTNDTIFMRYDNGHIEQQTWTLVVLANRTFHNIDYCVAERILESSVGETKITNRFLTMQNISYFGNFMDQFKTATTVTILPVHSSTHIVFYPPGDAVNRYVHSIVLDGIDECGSVLMTQFGTTGGKMIIVPETRCLFRYETDRTESKAVPSHFNKQITCSEYVNYQRTMLDIVQTFKFAEKLPRRQRYKLTEKTYKVYNTYAIDVLCVTNNFHFFCIARCLGIDAESLKVVDEMNAFSELPIHVISFMKKFSNCLANSTTGEKLFQLVFIMAAPKSYFITGVSCTFKSTTLDALDKAGIPVVKGDFADHCAQHPEFLTKHDSETGQLLYTLFASQRFRAGHINDRTPNDSIIYHEIFKVLKGLSTMKEAKANISNYAKLVFRPFNNRNVVFVFLPTDMQSLYKRTQKRGALLDDLDIKYLHIQYEIFKHVAEESFWSIRYISCFNDAVTAALELNSMRMLESKTQIISYTCNSEYPLRKANSYASGYDLPVPTGVTIEPGTSVRLSTGIRMSIPLGYTGIVAPRSSSFELPIMIGSGTIDCDYRGEILVSVYNLSSKPLNLEAGNSIAQIVVVKLGNTFMNVVNQLDKTERDEKGFGSSDKPYHEMVENLKKQQMPLALTIVPNCSTR